MRVLSLDASTKSGWALFVDGTLSESGALTPVKIEDFNVNKDPQKSPKYPYNIVRGAQQITAQVLELVRKCGKLDVVVIENTNKGRNRHTQRILEFMHFCILMMLEEVPQKMVYMDTSEWRSLVGLWMSKDDLKNNRDVKAKKKRGKISKKHLAVRMVNDLYGKNLKLKDNDEADAILMGQAFVNRSQK
jgi:hypothetical protein